MRLDQSGLDLEEAVRTPGCPWWRNNVARLPLAIKPGEVRRFSDGAILRRLDDGSGSPRYLGMTMTSRLPEVRDLTRDELRRLASFDGHAATDAEIDAMQRTQATGAGFTRRDYARLFIHTRRKWVCRYFDRLNEAARRA